MALENEGDQEGIRKDYFLNELISEIDELLEHEDSIKIFQNQFDSFCLMVENYNTELEKYRQTAKNSFISFTESNQEAIELIKDIDKLFLNEKLERLTKVKKLYIKQCSIPTNDIHKWILHGTMSDYVAEENWILQAPLIYRPPLSELPQNPVFWFFSEMDRYLSENDPIKHPDEKERLLCNFVRLAVIHDESCSYNKNVMIYKNRIYEGMFKRDNFTKDLWEAYKNPKNNQFISTHKRILKQALKHVKAYSGQHKTDEKNRQNVTPSVKETKNMIKIFISHSSKDKELAEKVTELVKNALHLHPNDIRCTTVDGYRLPGGAKTNEQLKREVCGSETFVGLISSAATDSMYVLFELGARWGSDKYLLPLLATGVSPNILKGPLSDLNALSCSNASQLHQMVKDLAEKLEIKPESPDTYQCYVDEILQINPSVNISQISSEQIETSSENRKNLQDDLEFEKASGIYISKEDGLSYCTNCLHSSSKKIPLKEQQNGWRCNVCGKFYSNPNFKSPPRGRRAP
jgi:hypothetical protein